MKFLHTYEKAGSSVPACLSSTPRHRLTLVDSFGVTGTRRALAFSSSRPRMADRRTTLRDRIFERSGDGCERFAWPPSWGSPPRPLPLRDRAPDPVCSQSQSHPGLARRVLRTLRSPGAADERQRHAIRGLDAGRTLDWLTPAERYNGTSFTDRGFENIPALVHLQGLAGGAPGCRLTFSHMYVGTSTRGAAEKPSR